MKQIKLSERLNTIAALVPAGARVADVGTDHARLAVALLQRGQAPSVIASDISPLPLRRAEATLRYWGLTGDPRVQLRLGAGLAPLAPDEVDTVVIAGMGGGTIADILAECPWVPGCAQTFLLQPMSSVNELRGGLYRLRFTIVQECLVQENETLYTVLRARQGPAIKPEPWMLYLSPALADSDDPLRDAYLQQTLRRLERALAGAERSGKPQDVPRAAHFTAALAGLRQLKQGGTEPCQP